MKKHLPNKNTKFSVMFMFLLSNIKQDQNK